MVRQVMVHVESDKTKGLLTIRFSGGVTPEQTRRSLAELERLAEELPRGFKLLSDLSRLESMDVACSADIERAMDICDCNGVAKVIRIIPDPSKDIGLNIMSLFHYRQGIPIVTCESLEEASNALST